MKPNHSLRNVQKENLARLMSHKRRCGTHDLRLAGLFSSTSAMYNKYLVTLWLEIKHPNYINE